MGLRRIRRAVREGRYEFTAHAVEEMDEDDLSEADVRQAVLHGSLAAELTDDPRGTRFVVRGRDEDERPRNGSSMPVSAVWTAAYNYGV